MFLAQYLYIFLALLICYSLFRAYRTRRGNVSLPPGPPSDPIIGNLRQLIPPIQETTYYEWHKRYGDVVYFNVLGKHIVMLNSEQAAKDLLDKRGLIYSDRPIGWEYLIVFVRYGEQFHKMRKLFQEALSRTGVLVFQDIQQHQAHVLLKNLLRSPDQFSDHVKRFASAVILEIAYGHRVENDDDQYLEITETVNEAVAGSGDAGVSIVDFFPILRHLPAWLPGTGIVQHCKRIRPRIDRAIDIPFNEVRERMASGSTEKSFLSMALENLQRQKKETEEELHLLKHSSHMFYSAGGDTTWSTIENFLLVILLHPRAQRKAQAEIDKVLMQRRLPDFGDREALPYVECVIQESMRWHPAVPLGVAHSVMEDDVYNGMFIPKGATVIANSTAITMDENVYDSPQAFYPERYLPKPEGNGEPISASIFGYGRRICPGRHLAEASVWIVISSILAAYEIVPAKDLDGNPIIPKAEYHTGITSRPKAFKCIIRPRSQRMKELVQDI